MTPSIAGKLVMIGLPGPELTTEAREFILRYGVRAVCFFRRNIESSLQAQALIGELRALMSPEALIAVDQEGGGVVRTRDLPFPPSAMSLGAANDAELAREVGAATARGLRSLGVNWNFAPVLDVNSNPENPVIADRSFGGDPERVARLALAWMAGSHEEGVGGCVKHFPGHGDTFLDSHLALPVVDKPREALERVELHPFKEAVKAGVPAVMTAHIVYPALDDQPATLSHSILSGLLRREWGYEGVVITDAMDMKAIAERYGRGEAAVRALLSGADMVIALGTFEAQEETLLAIEAARADGRLDEAALGASLSRLSRFAARFLVSPAPYDEVRRAEDGALFGEAWRRGLTPYGKPRPPRPGSNVLLVVAGEAPGGSASESGLAGRKLAEVLSGLYRLRAVYYERQDPLACLERAAMNPEETVVFASTSRHRLSAEERELARRLEPDLHLALWNPYAIRDVEAPALVSYGFRPGALQAVASWLEGKTDARGSGDLV